MPSDQKAWTLGEVPTSAHPDESVSPSGCLLSQLFRGGPPTTYGSLFFTMCQMIVASRRITATRAIFDPRRRLIRPYQARIYASRRNTCSTI